MGSGLSSDELKKATEDAMGLIKEMHDAKEYGSIINVSSRDWALLRRFAVSNCITDGQVKIDIHGSIEASEKLNKLINIGEALSQKYDVVVTNPPLLILAIVPLLSFTSFIKSVLFMLLSINNFHNPL